MITKFQILTFLLIILVTTVFFVMTIKQSAQESVILVPEASESTLWTGEVTERYAGRVDRVSVVFEHQDYTQYRLQTNDQVRTGELNTERGYGDDIDATVYILNWQQPEREQSRYVRLTVEPDHLYWLDSEGKIVTGSQLSLEPKP